MYAITGITGKVGGAVARSLLAAGQPVRAVVRDAARARSWAERGCEVVTADMDDQETARLVLQMDAAISAFRAGQCSGCTHSMWRA